MLNTKYEVKLNFLNWSIKMKLSKNVISAVLALLFMTLVVVGCEAWFKASKDGSKWMVEGGASAKAELKKK